MRTRERQCRHLKIFGLLWEHHLPFILCFLILLLIGTVYCYEVYPQIEFEVSGLNYGDILYVYHNNGSGGFDAEHVSKKDVKDCSGKYRFNIPVKDMLRIDFVTNEKNIRIHNVKLKTVFTDQNVSCQYMQSCMFSETVEHTAVEKDALLVEQNGTSWFIVLYDLDRIQDTANFMRISLFILYILLLMGMPVAVAMNMEPLLGFYKKITFKKWHAVVLSSILYLSVRLFFFKSYIGYFAFDEFYHISTADDGVAVNYDRALYINYIVKIFCRIFGKNDMVVKLIPFILGIISFICVLYLLYHLYDNPYWILTISIIYTLMPHLQYNQFYIRMYIFLEATVMVICVLIYHAESRRDDKWGKISFLLADMAAISYCVNVKDLSSKALFLLMIAVNIYYFWNHKMNAVIKTNPFLKAGAVFLCIACGAAELYLIAAKQYWIDTPLLKKISGLIGMDLEKFYHADSPVFLEFFAKKMFYVLIPFLISMVYMLGKKQSKKKTLFLIAGLPMLGYLFVFYDAYLIRSYIAYFPIICILSFIAFDKMKMSGSCHIAVIFVVTFLTLNIQPNFWEAPRISGETWFADYGGAVRYARDLEEMGYEIVPMMTYRTQSEYFDLLDAKINLNTADVLIGDKTNETYINEKLEQLLQSDERTAIIAGDKGIYMFQDLERMRGGNDNYKMKKFAGNTAVIIIN